MLRAFSLCILCPLSVLAVPREAHHGVPVSTEGAEKAGLVFLSWESRYVSEGRDNLDGDSLFGAGLEFGWGDLSAGLWYGKSYDQDYDEFNFNLTYSKTFEDLEVYVAYTRLEFPFENAHDDEVGAGLFWSGIPFEIGLAADIYYSFDAGGYFAEFALLREFEVSNDLRLELAGVFGVNQGYVADGHDGANHVGLRAGILYAVTESLQISVHLAQSWGIDRDSNLLGDELLNDFFHGGVGAEWAF